eukprot:scaffold2310_cov105-Isochrysis_galbana.AAC.6
MADDEGRPAMAAGARVLLIVIPTALDQRPERGELLERTVVQACTQRLAEDVRLELLVLDDLPCAAGWPHLCGALEGLSAATDGPGRADHSAGAQEADARPPRVSRGPSNEEHGLCGGGASYGSASCVRYVAVPADPATGRVCLRLKRNLALEMATACRSDWLLFFDDDDWRSADAAQASQSSGSLLAHTPGWVRSGFVDAACVLHRRRSDSRNRKPCPCPHRRCWTRRPLRVRTHARPRCSTCARSTRR